MIECAFLIPINHDKGLSDGGLHSTDAWDWLIDQLWDRFKGATIAPELYRGFYLDPDTGERVEDSSRKYFVAVPDDPQSIEALRTLLREACVVFCQKCLYLSISGTVEFIGGPSHDST